MQFAPGPIPTIDASGSDLTIDNPGFTDLVQQSLNDLPSLEGSLDVLIDPMTLFADELPDGGELAGVDPVTLFADGLGEQLANNFDSGQMDQAAAITDKDFLDTYELIPGEAWGSPILPWDAPAAPPSGAPIQAVTLRNLSNPGATDFLPGDSFSFDLTGMMQINPQNPYQLESIRVYANFTKNGYTQEPVGVGISDANGNISYQGQWTGNDVGTWTGFFAQYPYPSATSGLDAGVWNVRPPPPPPSPNPISVTLVNPSHPGESAFSVGDAYQLIVRGVPNADVQIAATFNGAQLPPVSIGSTDATGLLNTSGVFTAAHVGNWSESYTVGGFAWDGTLTFSIS